LYLGRSVSLRRRVASYWGDLGDRGHLAAMVARIARVEAVPCDSAHEAAWLERNLLERRKPLIRRRDLAAGRLAFEFAGRLQGELEGLDWITAEQKVTQAEPSDFDVAGWADGVLVCFAIRGGCLCRWSQRTCGAAAARRHLAETPGAWAPGSRLGRLRPPQRRTGGAPALTPCAVAHTVVPN
jgi:excinuclease UvrABC nuclease subunit